MQKEQLQFTTPLNKEIQFGILSKVLPTEGNLAWEYNPFRNYRLSEGKYYFRDKFFNTKELLEELDALNKVYYNNGYINIEKGKFAINNVKYTIHRGKEGINLTNKFGKSIVLEKNKFVIDGVEYTLIEITQDFINAELIDWQYFHYSSTFLNGIKEKEQEPQFYAPNQLVDFDTDELQFDINHPVDILPQYSYDGSVNLILNDGKNIPRLINSRFTPIGRNKYKIQDRKGNNDTNIYDQGSQFDLDTSLYKTYVSIPKLEFINVYQSGNMSVGNYHFYFRYVDADGNETDFVAESGVVSVFKGNTLKTINSGLMDENAYKSVKFLLSNVDSAYQYVNVYYTKSTSNIYEPSVVKAYKIKQKYPVNNSLICQVYITGNEEVEEIPLSDINPFYQISQNVQTQADCQNMLFFGNIQNQNINYDELSDLSLRFCAFPDCSKSYEGVSQDYDAPVQNTYSDPKFIYNFVGYQNHEIYRFGVVYLMNDGSLSPVFNIRGMYFSESNPSYTSFKIEEEREGIIQRLKISFNEDTGIIYKSDGSTTNATEIIENAFGVTRIHIGESEFERVIGIKIGIDSECTSTLLPHLKALNVKGLFFVRQKRIPIRLCQAFVTGVDSEANVPLLYSDEIDMTSASKDDVESGSRYITERFLNDSLELVQDVESRFYAVRQKAVGKYGAFCPEYDVNGPYLNNLFCGDEYIVQQATNQAGLQQSSIEPRHFYVNNYTPIASNSYYKTRILGVEDNTKLVAIGSKMFSARAGEAEEAKYFEYITTKIKVEEANNILRGVYGPYLALDGYNIPGTIVNIYINDYIDMDIISQFKLRYVDKAPYYAISDRVAISDFENEKVMYRGDSYICTFTHRVNRNFQDPSAPMNDQIVDPDCWKDNFKMEDGVLKSEEAQKINLGDLNAVQLGTWVTFKLVSSINLNIRTLDDSIPDEIALTGHARGFYPYDGMCVDGPYKTPEALCYNKGFDKSVSERWNYEVPDVPFIKNEFSNRIAYSDVAVNDAFRNGFRTFQGTSYRDYPKTYGSITKLIELNGQLLCVFEHGVALLPIRERTLTGQGAGGNVYINTNNVLPETMNVLSDTFGSQWKDSIIQTPQGVYGVDTVAKKIWKATGDSFKIISDFAIQEFLNNNISLTERELDPIIGIRNVKSHYNKYKQDIMFTFYDNLYGFEEKVWNICFNELLNKWITFYSWVPSYSENIYNQYFSFDRNTSKWITKLGVSKTGNSFSDGVTLSENIIKNNLTKGQLVGILDLANRTLPNGDNIEVIKHFELVRDNFRNWEKFEIKDTGQKDSEKHPIYGLYLKVPATDLCSEFYERRVDKQVIYSDTINSESDIQNWKNQIVLQSKGKIYKDERGRRKWLQHDNQINGSTPVYLLNIRCNIEVIDHNSIPTLAEAYNNNLSSVDAGYYESVVAVTTKYNMQFLTTDFWKHGQAGIINIADKIFPTYWYGKQHPFEFECVVTGDPRQHKIFDNLELIGNKTAPESFHYEIIGECYDFAKDKKNMYIRQEATKELYQYNGSDILYNSDYKDLEPTEHKRIEVVDPITKMITLSPKYDRSTLLPLYYSRQDTFNEVEDYYRSKTSPNKDYSKLAGAEIVRYENLNEYRIWNHTKAVDVNSPGGRMRGNMQYKEDKWDVQINPINIVYCNEPAWDSNPGTYNGVTVHYKGQENLVPIELGQSPIPNDVKDFKNIEVPENYERSIVVWNWEEDRMKESKLKDKFVKIRVRYTGDELALIAALKTNYSISIS